MHLLEEGGIAFCIVPNSRVAFGRAKKTIKSKSGQFGREEISSEDIAIKVLYYIAMATCF